MKASEEKYKNSMILIDGEAKSGSGTIVRYFSLIFEEVHTPLWLISPAPLHLS